MPMNIVSKECYKSARFEEVLNVNGKKKDEKLCEPKLYMCVCDIEAMF